MQQQQQRWDYSFHTSSGWPKFAYVTNPVPPETRHVTNKLRSQGRSRFRLFLCFRHSTSKTHSRSFWTLRKVISLVTSCFFLSSFWCCYERIPIHTALSSHFISLVRPAHHLFLSSRGRLLDSRKRRLFYLHMQHTIRCIFERRTTIRSSETLVCGFYPSISIQSWTSDNNLYSTKDN